MAEPVAGGNRFQAPGACSSPAQGTIKLESPPAHQLFAAFGRGKTTLGLSLQTMDKPILASGLWPGGIMELVTLIVHLHLSHGIHTIPRDSGL